MTFFPQIFPLKLTPPSIQWSMASNWTHPGRWDGRSHLHPEQSARLQRCNAPSACPSNHPGPATATNGNRLAPRHQTEQTTRRPSNNAPPPHYVPSPSGHAVPRNPILLHQSSCRNWNPLRSINRSPPSIKRTDPSIQRWIQCSHRVIEHRALPAVTPTNRYATYHASWQNNHSSNDRWQ